MKKLLHTWIDEMTASDRDYVYRLISDAELDCGYPPKVRKLLGIDEAGEKV
jgi:hypothetical protein